MNIMIKLFKFFFAFGLIQVLCPIFLLAYYIFSSSQLPIQKRLILLIFIFLPILLKKLIEPHIHKINPEKNNIYVFIAIVIGSVLLARSGNEYHAHYMIVSLSLYIGYLYVAATSEYSEIIEWIESPLEYGETPQNIKLVHSEIVDWNGYQEKCNLFKFTIENEVEYGITGPITFSLMEEIPAGSSYQEILQIYKKWYVGENIKNHIDDQINDYLDDKSNDT